MTNIQLTNQQIQYLIQLSLNEEDNIITKVAEHFQCSKANSKYIMDRMVVIGVLYKDKNIYRLTSIGNNLAEKLNYEKNMLKDSISILMKKNKEESLEIANKLMCQETESFRNLLIEITKYSIHDYKKGDFINSKQLKELLGKGDKNISYGIYKASQDSERSNLQESMAQKGFEEDARLHINEDSYIYMGIKKIRRSLGGYKKTGVVTNLFYKINGKNKNLEVVDGQVKIPLDSITSWKFLSNNIIQGGLLMETEAMIGFNKHIEKAIFIFLVDLLDLELKLIPTNQL